MESFGFFMMDSSQLSQEMTGGFAADSISDSLRQKTVSLLSAPVMLSFPFSQKKHRPKGISPFSLVFVSFGVSAPHGAWRSSAGRAGAFRLSRPQLPDSAH